MTPGLYRCKSALFVLSLDSTNTFTIEKDDLVFFLDQKCADSVWYFALTKFGMVKSFPTNAAFECLL